MDLPMPNTVPLPAPQIEESCATPLIDQTCQQYGNTYVSGSGLTILGNVGTVLQPRPEPDSIAKFGLCLGSAPQIDPAYFVGRAAEIALISQFLQPENAGAKQRRVVLGGMGGVGKTQLAITYAEQYQQSYDSIFWLNATSQLTLHTDLRLVAGRFLQASQLEKLDDKQVIIRVHEWLSNTSNARWLLIFDNYDEPTEFDIGRYCPYTSHGSIVITTRLPDHLSLSSEYIRVKPLSDVEESLDILQKRSQRQNIRKDPYARRLAERLAGLPLALATAGAYLNRRISVTFDQYLNAYDQRWNIDPRRPLQLQEYQDRTLYTTWDVSYARLKEDDLAAAQMLRLLAYFDNQRIWYELFSVGEKKDLPTPLSQLVSNQIDFDGVMSTLVEYCFVEIQATTQSYSMHNCVHDWTLGALNTTVDQQLYLHAFSCIAASIDNDWKSLDRLRYAHLTAHAIRLMHPSFSRDQLLNDIEVDRTRHIIYTAKLLRAQVQLTSAEEMFVRALAVYEKILGPDHPSTLHAVNSLGVLYYDQSRIEKAEQMLVRTLAGLEKNLEPDHTLLLGVLNNLGVLYSHEGKLDKAEQMYKRALVGHKRSLNSDHISEFNTLNNLGNLYRIQGKLDESEQMYIRVLAGYEKTLEPNHSSILNTVNNLGVLYFRQGKLDEAEQMLRRALAGFQETLGPGHILTIDSQHELANLCCEQGKLDLAESMFKQALIRYEEAVGNSHTRTLVVVNDFGALYEDQDRLEEATRMYQRALAGFQKQLGSEHWRTRKVAYNLNRIYRRQGKTGEAD